MPRFRSKPQEVEAVQWTGDWYAMETFAVEHIGSTQDSTFDEDTGQLVGVGPIVLTLLAGKHGAQGWVDVPLGHWIVRQPDDHTDYWPVDPDYFDAKYEPVTEEN